MAQSPVQQKQQQRELEMASLNFRVRAPKKWQFLTRMCKFGHLEFDLALQQMMWTVIDPRRVYRHHNTQKKMRGYLARDDPAFLILLCSFMSVSGLLYGVWLHLSFLKILLSSLWAVLGDLLVSGAIVATLLWWFSNVVLSPKRKWDISWAYCFDVHLNAFCPLGLGLFGIQLILWHVLSHDNIASLIIGNILWLVSLTYYIFISFLGYATLPDRKNAVALLVVTIPVVIVFILSLALRWNFADLFGSFIKWRCGG